MAYYLYQLTFDTPVHFGDASFGGSLERSSWEYTSDRLFSSLCCEMASQGEMDLIDNMVQLAQDGQFLLSDLLPYQLGAHDDLELFLPIPYVYMEGKEKIKNLDMQEAKKLSAHRKQVKKQAYCRVSELEEYCSCLRSGEIFRARSQWEPGAEQFAERVNCRGEKKLPYYVKNNIFRQGAGMYFIVQMPDDMEGIFGRVLESLGLSGIGGKRSSGCGRFHLADDPLLLEPGIYQDTDCLYAMLTARSKGYMCISSLLPEPHQADIVRQGMYRLRKSSGFTDGIKRNSIYMLAAGSYLPEKLPGLLLDMGESNGHPVWRYGKGLYVGIGWG